jgi:hypothetical protein
MPAGGILKRCFWRESKTLITTQAVYTEKYTPKELFDDVISKFDFGIDLTHLKNSKFVQSHIISAVGGRR